MGSCQPTKEFISFNEYILHTRALSCTWCWCFSLKMTFSALSGGERRKARGTWNKGTHWVTKTPLQMLAKLWKLGQLFMIPKMTNFCLFFNLRSNPNEIIFLKRKKPLICWPTGLGQVETDLMIKMIIMKIAVIWNNCCIYAAEFRSVK